MAFPPPPPPPDDRTFVKPTSRKRLVYALIVIFLLVGALGIWYVLTYGVGGLGGAGQTRNVSVLDVAVTSMTKTDLFDCQPVPWFGGTIDLDIEAGVGEDLIVVDLKLKNTANYPIYVYLSYAYAVNTYGTQYLSSSNENVDFYQRNALSKQLEKAYQNYTGYTLHALPPGTEVAGKEIFRVPEGSPGLKIVYHISVTGYYAEGQIIHGERGTVTEDLSWNV